MALILSIRSSGGRAKTAALDILRRGARAFFVGLSAAAIVAAAVPVHAEGLKVRSVDSAKPGNVVVTVDVPADLSPPPADVKLRFDNSPPLPATNVKAVDRPQGPQVVAVCVDRSGSMGRAAVDDARQALEIALERSDPQLDFSIIEFGSNARTLAAFGSERTEANKRLRELRPEAGEHKTKLNDAILGAISAAQEQTRARGGAASGRVIVISDGKDEGSTATPPKVVEKARAAGVSINGIAIGRLAQQSGSSLESLARSTGGVFVLAEPGVPSLSRALEQALASGRQAAAKSMVASFEYTPSVDGRTANAAMLEIVRPNASPLQERIQAQFALPATKPADPLSRIKEWIIENKSTLSISLGLGALLAAVLLYMWLRRRKDQNGAIVIPPTPEKVVVDLPPVTPPQPKRPRETMINRYVFTPPAPNRPTALLCGISGPAGGRDFAIDKALFRIGASAANDMRLGDDDLVSGEHAYIKFDSGSLYLLDRQSRNGTFLNGTRLKDAAMPLSPGDQIRIGDSTFDLRAPRNA